MLLLLLLAWCFLIIRPFILIVLWAIILAVALFPLYSVFVKKMGVSKKKLTTVLYTLIMALLFIIPSYFIVGSVVDSTISTTSQIRSNEFQIPAPDEKVKEWPLIGNKVYDDWLEASKDIEKYSVIHKDFILEQGKALLSGFKGFMGALISFFISFLIAMIFMYKSEHGYKSAYSFLNKLVGEDDSKEMLQMSRDTVRSVVKGILLVALIQCVLSFIGFKAIGLPGAGIFAFAVLVTAIVQIPAILTMIPAIILAFSIADTTPAVIFAIYCILVGMSDNVLKPLLLGKGLKTPMVIILIGTIGGMLLHGIIGLFLGPVVLAVMHRIYVYWINAPKTVDQ